MGQLIVTCDAPPIPPLTGHNRKTHDLLAALAGDVAATLVCYPADPAEAEAIRAYWAPRGVAVTMLRRRNPGRHARSLWQRLSLPTVTRDFEGEARVVGDVVRRGEAVRVLVDFLSGAPLVDRVRGGVVVSGHDCLSLLFQEEARYASGLRARCHFWVRRQFALTAERRYAHLADRFHVVSRQDADALARVNPAARLRVIPIGGTEVSDGILRAAGPRRHRVIWGNLGSEVIAVGMRQLLAAAQARSGVLDGWTVVGRLPHAAAASRFPGMQRLGIRYVPRLEDVEGGLAAVSCLLLPDVSGTGQKNRTMDGLAHGCCLAGLDEVFRGVPEEGGNAYVKAADFGTLLDRMSRISPEEAVVIGQRGRACFAREFSLPAMRQRWLALLEEVGPVPGSGEPA